MKRRVLGGGGGGGLAADPPEPRARGAALGLDIEAVGAVRLEEADPLLLKREGAPAEFGDVRVAVSAHLLHAGHGDVLQRDHPDIAEEVTPPEGGGDFEFDLAILARLKVLAKTVPSRIHRLSDVDLVDGGEYEGVDNPFDGESSGVLEQVGLAEAVVAGHPMPFGGAEVQDVVDVRRRWAAAGAIDPPLLESLRAGPLVGCGLRGLLLGGTALPIALVLLT